MFSFVVSLFPCVRRISQKRPGVSINFGVFLNVRAPSQNRLQHLRHTCLPGFLSPRSDSSGLMHNPMKTDTGDPGHLTPNQLVGALFLPWLHPTTPGISCKCRYGPARNPDSQPDVESSINSPSTRWPLELAGSEELIFLQIRILEVFWLPICRLTDGFPRQRNSNRPSGPVGVVQQLVRFGQVFNPKVLTIPD